MSAQLRLSRGPPCIALHLKKNTMMQTQAKFLKCMAAVLISGTVLFNIACAQARPQPADNQLVLPAQTYSIPFYWQGDSVNSKWEPHTAILIPVKLKNCPKQFYMQFDLGSPYSLFYTNKLAAIQSKYPKALQLDKTADKLLNFSFKAGKMPVTAKEIVVKQFDSSSINWKSNSIEIIGTLGVDLIDGKTAVIDYPAKKLVLSAAVSPKLLPRLSLNDFMYVGRRILFPSVIQGKQTMLYFDTGSSMYELLTSKQTCEALAVPGTALIQNKVWSWSRFLTANSLASNASITIGGINVPVHYVTYMEGTSNSQAEQMMKMGIGGMTGNKIFLDYKLVLDTKNKKFGLVK